MAALLKKIDIPSGAAGENILEAVFTNVLTRCVSEK